MLLGQRAPACRRSSSTSSSTSAGSSVSVNGMRTRHMQVASTALKGSSPAAALRPAAYAQRQQQKGSLRLFLDSADVRLWEQYQNGSLYGFTTNPLILSKDQVPCTLASFRTLVEKARQLQAQELQIQAWGGSAAAMEAAALRVLDLDPGLITIKLPCTPDGLAAASALMARDGSIAITITGVYAPHQVLLAQAVGADYVAPYLGRMSDGDITQLALSHRQLAFRKDAPEPMEAALEAVLSMQAAVDASGSSMRILVASIRAAEQMAILAANGCNTFTFSPAVMEQLACVPETLQAAADFEAAAAGNGAEW